MTTASARTTESVAGSLVAAFRAHDLAEIEASFAPDGVRWLNITGEEIGVAELMALARREREVLATSELTETARLVSDDGFVLQLRMTGSTLSGTDFDFPVCLVARVTDGRVSRMDEYVDSSQVAGLAAAVFARQEVR